MRVKSGVPALDLDLDPARPPRLAPNQAKSSASASSTSGQSPTARIAEAVDVERDLAHARTDAALSSLTTLP